MTAQACPVCAGRQTVDLGFYDGIALGTARETCRTCDGQGAVAVEILPVVSIPSCWAHEPGGPSVVTYTSPDDTLTMPAPSPYTHIHADGSP